VFDSSLFVLKYFIDSFILNVYDMLDVSMGTSMAGFVAQIENIESQS